MNLDALRRHPAYAALSSEERAAVDARVGAHALDVTLAASAGDVDTLEAADLRFWLASTASRPWAGILLAADPEAVLSLFEGLVDAAPGLAQERGREPAVQAAREYARAVGAIDAERRHAGFARDGNLGPVVHRMRVLAETADAWTEDAVLSVTRAAGFEALVGDLRAWLRDEDGIAAIRRRFRAGVVNDAFNHRTRANFVFAGTPQHEGHFDGTTWRNWADDLAMAPRRYVVPRTEAELCAAVASADEARVVGGGHSFNAGPLSPDTMISLDAYDRVVAIDRAARTARVQAGIRLRDLNKALDAAGLGLPVLGSTDPQSLGGLIATDLHGTGREHGYLSTQVTGVRVVAADGSVRWARSGDPLFHAVFGAVGVCGLVAEVELALVDAFRLEKSVAIVDQEATFDDLDTVLADNDHVSFYCVGGAKQSRSMQIHRWNRTEAPLTKNWERIKRRDELSDFHISAFAPELTRLAADMAPERAEVVAPASSIVLPASRAFGRKLYYRHDELEQGVPMDRWRAALEAVLEVHRRRDLFSVIEVRFTPDNSPALLGPGVGRPTCWIGLATPMHLDRAVAYGEVEAVLRAHGGRPHLGKQTFTHAAEMLQAYGERFVEFQEVRAAQDPGGTFLNEFTRRLFG